METAIIEVLPNIYSPNHRHLSTIFGFIAGATSDAPVLLSTLKALSDNIKSDSSKVRCIDRVVCFDCGLQQAIDKYNRAKREEKEACSSSEGQTLGSANSVSGVHTESKNGFNQLLPNLDSSQFFEFGRVDIVNRSYPMGSPLTVENILSQAKYILEKILPCVSSDSFMVNSLSKKCPLVIGASYEHHLLLISTLQMLLCAETNETVESRADKLIISLRRCTYKLIPEQNSFRNRIYRHIFMSSSLKSKSNKTLLSGLTSDSRFASRVWKEKQLLSMIRALKNYKWAHTIELASTLFSLDRTPKNTKEGSGDRFDSPQMVLRKVILSHVPKCDIEKASLRRPTCRPYLMIMSGDGASVIYSSLVKGVKEETYEKNRLLSFDVNCTVRADFTIRLYHLPIGQSGKQILEKRFNTMNLAPREDFSISRRFPKSEQLVLTRTAINNNILYVNGVLNTLKYGIHKGMSIFDRTFEMQVLLSLPSSERKFQNLESSPRRDLQFSRNEGARNATSAVVPMMKEEDFCLPFQLKCHQLFCDGIFYFEKYRSKDAETVICPRCKMRSTFPSYANTLIELEKRCQTLHNEVESIVHTNEGDRVNATSEADDTGETEKNQVITAENRDGTANDQNIYRAISTGPLVEADLPREMSGVHLQERVDLLCEIFEHFERRELVQTVGRILDTSTTVQEFEMSLNTHISEVLITENSARSAKKQQIATSFGDGIIIERRDQTNQIVVKLDWGGILYMQDPEKGDTSNDLLEQLANDERFARQLENEEKQEVEALRRLSQALERHSRIGAPMYREGALGSENFLSDHLTQTPQVVSLNMRGLEILLDMHSRLEFPPEAGRLTINSPAVDRQNWIRRRTGASRESINSLPSYSFRKGSGAGSYDEGTANKCMICQYKYKDGDVLRTLPCIHSYHSDCIEPWLLQNKVCPVCQRNVDL